MDSPQVAWKVEWARAVSTVSILNETITPHAWKNPQESSPPPPLSFTSGKHPTHERNVGERLATSPSQLNSRAWRRHTALEGAKGEAVLGMGPRRPQAQPQ